MVNVFLNSYIQPENRLTYNFLALLDHTNSGEMIGRLLDMPDLADEPILRIDTVMGGGKSNPDGSILLRRKDHTNFVVYVEVKSWRLPLTSGQLQSHVNHRLKSGDLLLVITPKPEDLEKCLEVNGNLVFRTWNRVAQILSASSDSRLVGDFVDWGYRMGEFEIMDDISREDIDVVVRYNRTNFYTRFRHILQEIKVSLPFSTFGMNFNELTLKDAWGRVGYEVYFPDPEYGQWLFFGLYHDPKDHGIPLKERNTPELAFFLDVDKEEATTRLDRDATLSKELADLASLGYESNINGALTRNRWRLLALRKPITEFERLDSRSLLLFVNEVLVDLSSPHLPRVRRLVGLE